MTTQFNRSTIGVAAEYAVASELCRRGVYAQLTLGHQKRTDLLVFSESGQLSRIEVKAKQGLDCPNCRGVCGANAFLIFVDYQYRAPDERPAFFVLSSHDWRRVLLRRIAEFRKKDPSKRIKITSENVAVFLDQIGKSGKPYEGMGIRAAHIEKFRERWDKVLAAVGVP